MRAFRYLVAALALLAGCGKQGAPADPPTDVALVAADGSVTVTWTMVPDVEYWLFYAPAKEITRENWASLPGVRVVRPAASPAVIGGLANGTTYSFMINGRIDDGPGGPPSPSLSAVPRLAGASWIAAAPLAADLHGVAYGGTFVAVGAGGAIYSGTDGKAWTQRDSTVTSALDAALYSSGSYLAAGAGGVILRSTDATNWASQASNTASDLYALGTNGSGRYVAAGAGGTIVTSSDGQNWSAASSGIATTSALYGVTYGNSLYVAVGAAGTLLTSADASSWASMTPVTGSDLRSVAWGNNIFVAVGAGGALVTSPDGAAWTAQTPLAAGTLRSVAYGRQFVAVGDTGTVFTSPDGLAWQAQASGTTQNLLAVTPAVYGYSAVGAAGTNLTAY